MPLSVRIFVSKIEKTMNMVFKPNNQHLKDIFKNYNNHISDLRRKT